MMLQTTDIKLNDGDHHCISSDVVDTRPQYLIGDRLSIPEPGRTIQSSIKNWTDSLSSVFHSMVKVAEEKGLQNEIAQRYRLTFYPIIPVGDGFSLQPQQAVKLASSALLSIWMLYQVVHRDNKNSSIVEAEKWFLEEAPRDIPIISEIDGWLSEIDIQQLSHLSYGEEFIDLLPYILETFEFYSEGSHTSLNDFAGKGKRRNSHVLKRRGGIFYTPSDVTEYISKEIINSWVQSNGQNYSDLSCLDPACGTGVFLLAILRKIESYEPLNTATRCLYGMDISPQAVQSCVFVILFECLQDIFDKQIPLWRAWHAIRGNFAVIDSTIVNGIGKSESQETHSMQRWRMKIRKALLNSNQEIKYHRFDYAGLDSLFLSPRLGDLFEEVTQGFSIVISNPPYLKSKYRRNGFVSIGSDNLYTLFVEMMWRFTRQDYSMSSMIVPLSIAYHSGKAFKALRYRIKNINGEWIFHFFDRTPDSIFGDDIKTRNTIMFFKRGKFSENIIKSSQLIRWNSRNRSYLFKNLKTQSLHSIPINDLIPKIGTKEELITYQSLHSQQKKIGSLGENLPSSLLSTCNENNQCVFYYQTAYNWLPIFRSVPQMQNTNTTIPESIRGLGFKNEREAKFFFTIASSHLAYWLWRVEGDGFHLNNNFLMRLPFHPDHFSNENIKRLEDLADALWTRLQQYPIVSSNSGQKIPNYCPYGCVDILDEIDSIIIDTYNIDHSFMKFLRKFVVNNIIVNRENEPKYNAIFHLLSERTVTEL